MALSPGSAEPFKYGTPGTPDILGILCTGHLIGFEVKTGGATQNQEQKNFEAMIARFNGFYFVVRSEWEAFEYMKQALKAVGVEYV